MWGMVWNLNYCGLDRMDKLEDLWNHVVDSLLINNIPNKNK